MKENIHQMFDQISSTYDRVNRVMTFNMDQSWRKKMARFLPPGETLSVLDCATGTADQIIALMETVGNIEKATGIDLAAEMVAIGKKKISEKPYADRVSFQIASALELPFPDKTFDCVTISFGIRNVTDVEKALIEFRRVLKPNGRLLILEGSVPQNKFLKRLHLFYLRNIMPRIGGFISKKPLAYRYLNQTIETFPCGEAFCDLMRKAGFKAAAHPLLFGAATIYVGIVV